MIISRGAAEDSFPAVAAYSVFVLDPRPSGVANILTPLRG